MRISTPTPRRQAGGGGRAFTLVELMAAALLGAIILLGILTTNLQLMRGGVRITQYAEMNTQIRRGLEQFERDVRCASAVKWNSSRDVTFTLPTLAGGTRQVTYAWTSATQSFFLVPGVDSTVTAGRVYLLNGIPTLASGGDGVVFTRYDRDGNAASTDNATKSIQVTLYLTRTARTAATATDTAVSAVFVLRNKPVS